MYRGDTVKTTSILNLLNSMFDKKVGFTQEELDKITFVSISRMSYTGTLFDVDFSDLKLFKNLKKISIDHCMIDSSAMEIVASIPNLTNISLYNCDVLDNAYSSFNKIQTRNLLFSNTKIDLSKISGYFDTVTLENVDVRDIECHGELIDISRCDIKDIDVITTSSFKEIIVSNNQYLEFQIFFDKCNKHIIVMEENGQFILKEVNLNG